MPKNLKCDNLNAVRLVNGGSFKNKSKLMNKIIENKMMIKSNRFKIKYKLMNKIIEWIGFAEECNEIYAY